MRLVLIAALAMTTAACSSSKSQFGRLPIPPLDSLASTPCRDPGVDADPRIAIAETRLSLAECEGKRALAASAYEEVRRQFGVQP